jgi:hypothetical protein
LFDDFFLIYLLANLNQKLGYSHIASIKPRTRFLKKTLKSLVRTEKNYAIKSKKYFSKLTKCIDGNCTKTQK